MLPGLDGFKVCRATPRGRRLVTGPDADGPRRRPGPRRRARRRGRRLPDQAVLLRGAARPASRAGPPGRARAPDGAHRRLTAARPRAAAASSGATTEIELSAKEFSLLETLMRNPGQRPEPLRAPRARLGLRVRESLERRRLVRPLPAREGGQALRRQLDRDRPGRGLPPPRGRRREDP